MRGRGGWHSLGYSGINSRCYCQLHLIKIKKRKKTKRKENCHAEAKSLEFILFTSPAGYLLVTLLTMPLQEM